MRITIQFRNWEFNISTVWHKWYYRKCDRLNCKGCSYRAIMFGPFYIYRG
jgi:hypothetical protein